MFMHVCVAACVLPHVCVCVACVLVCGVCTCGAYVRVSFLPPLYDMIALRSKMRNLGSVLSRSTLSSTLTAALPSDGP